MPSGTERRRQRREDRELRRSGRGDTSTGVDPVYGAEYEYDEPVPTAGLVRRFRERRGRRRADRGESQAREEAMAIERERRIVEDMDRGVAAWDRAEGLEPTVEELLGGADMKDWVGQERYLDSTALGDARADEGSIAAQRRALQQLQGIYDAGGYTAAERAQMQQARMDALATEAQQRGAIQQQMAARGMGGSGAELAGMLSAGQGSANAMMMANNQATIAGQQRALQALQASGDVAGQMRGQSFGEAATRGQAVDDFNRTNLQRRDQYQQARRDYYDRSGLASQQRLQNAQQTAAGRTGQFSATSGAMGSAQDRAGAAQRAQDERIQGYINSASGAVGSIV